VLVNKEHFFGYRKESQFDSIAISISRLIKRFANYINMHTPEQFGQPADLHPDTLPELIRTASRFIFGQF
ncbi:hypothetical protein, partial [Aliarcobacter butzleri]|uniref:hypothetical protein n=1 Tax=Aliarcobacter butzleri TaxID=28197 RepID=UPI002B2489DD